MQAASSSAERAQVAAPLAARARYVRCVFKKGAKAKRMLIGEVQIVPDNSEIDEGGGGVLLVMLFLLIIVVSGSSDVATVEVMRGEFVIDIKTRGEIDALNSTNISLPRIRRRMSLQIVNLAPEGTIVKKGDFLIQLDQSEMQQNVDEAKDELARLHVTGYPDAFIQTLNWYREAMKTEDQDQ